MPLGNYFNSKGVGVVGLVKAAKVILLIWSALLQLSSVLFLKVLVWHVGDLETGLWWKSGQRPELESSTSQVCAPGGFFFVALAGKDLKSSKLSINGKDISLSA